MMRIDRSFALMWQATHLMEALWEAARERYLGATRTHIKLFNDVDLSAIYKHTGQVQDLSPSTVSSPLRYYDTSKREWQIELGGPARHAQPHEDGGPDSHSI
jgi:hypothetical protein